MVRLRLLGTQLTTLAPCNRHSFNGDTNVGSKLEASPRPGIWLERGCLHALQQLQAGSLANVSELFAKSIPYRG